MIFQVAAVFERSITNTTLVRSIFDMCLLVNVETSPMIERCVANGALVRFFTWKFERWK